MTASDLLQGRYTGFQWRLCQAGFRTCSASTCNVVKFNVGFKTLRLI